MIPAKRHELAENIGKMVGNHLLTSEDVRQALTQQAFQVELQQLLDQRLAAILARDLGPVASLVPERFHSYFTLGIMAALVGGFLSPELIDQKIRSYLAEKGEDLAGCLLDEAVQEKSARAGPC